MTRLSWAWAWALAMAMVGTAWGQTVYWIDQEGNGVHRATVGGEQMLFAERLHGAGEVAVDGADGVIIWRQPEGMRQGTLELDTIEEFDVGIDGGGGKFVLSRETDEYFFVSGWTIYRGELGSTGVTEVISYEDGEQGAYTRLIAALAVDELNRKLYYVYYYYIRTGIIDGGIFRINFDGSGAEQLIEDPGVGITEQLAIDPEGGWIFWDSVREIKRARLDGSDVSIVVSGQRDGVLALAVNPVTDQLLWIANTLPGQFRLFASELDGSMARLFGGEILEPGGLAVDEVTGRIYWGELNGIGRLEADGSGRVQLGPGFAQPYRLQLDAEARTLTVAMEGKVQASGLEAWSATDLNLNEDIGTVLGIDVNAETGRRGLGGGGRSDGECDRAHSAVQEQPRAGFIDVAGGFGGAPFDALRPDARGGVLGRDCGGGDADRSQPAGGAGARPASGPPGVRAHGGGGIGNGSGRDGTWT